MIAHILLASTIALGLPSNAASNRVGEKLPEVVLEGLSQTAATSYEEFTGRLVLLEFFAHW